MKILDYELELEDIKENELPESDTKELQEFNESLVEEFGIDNLYVLENDNLLYTGKIRAMTKRECDAKLTLLIAKLKSKYKKYGIKRVAKKLLMYGTTIY